MHVKWKSFSNMRTHRTESHILGNQVTLHNEVGKAQQGHFHHPAVCIDISSFNYYIMPTPCMSLQLYRLNLILLVSFHGQSSVKVK